MAPANSKMRSREIGLGKWLQLPLYAWNDLADIKSQFPQWSESVAIATAIHFYADHLAAKQLENEDLTTEIK